MKVLIIGGHGMLGRPVVRRLLDDSFDVRVMARSPAKAEVLLPGKANVIQGDLELVASIDQALEGCQAAYLSVDTTAGMRFEPETDGLKNLITAMKNHPEARLLVLSAYGSSTPRAASHPWWHVRVKHEAQRITMNSGLQWTLLEPTWFMESLPLFVKGRTFSAIKGSVMQPYWIAGTDFGRMISTALSRNIGIGEHVPVQGQHRFTLLEAGRRFIDAFDPALKIKEIPLWLIQLVGLFSSKAKDFAALMKMSNQQQEPAPDTAVWKRFGKPVTSIEQYAHYVKETGDFPQK